MYFRQWEKLLVPYQRNGKKNGTPEPVDTITGVPEQTKYPGKFWKYFKKVFRKKKRKIDEMFIGSKCYMNLVYKSVMNIIWPISIY